MVEQTKTEFEAAAEAAKKEEEETKPPFELETVELGADGNGLLPMDDFEGEKPPTENKDAKEETKEEKTSTPPEKTSETGKEGEDTAGKVTETPTEEESEEEEGEQGTKPPAQVPYGRFSKVVAERNAAREKLAEERGRSSALKEQKQTQPEPKEEEENVDELGEPWYGTKGEFREALKEAEDRAIKTVSQEQAKAQFRNDIRYFKLAEKQFSATNEDYNRLLHEPSDEFPEGLLTALDPEQALAIALNEDSSKEDAEWARQTLEIWNDALTADDPAVYMLDFARRVYGESEAPTLDTENEESVNAVLSQLNISREEYDAIQASKSEEEGSEKQAAEPKPTGKKKSLRNMPAGKGKASEIPEDPEEVFNSTFPVA